MKKHSVVYMFGFIKQKFIILLMILFLGGSLAATKAVAGTIKSLSINN